MLVELEVFASRIRLVRIGRHAPSLIQEYWRQKSNRDVILHADGRVEFPPIETETGTVRVIIMDQRLIDVTMLRHTKPCDCCSPIDPTSDR